MNWFKNIFSYSQPKEQPKKLRKLNNVLEHIQYEQLERVSKDINDWRNAVNEAEDNINPDRYRLMQFFKDFIDDYQLWSAMQQRTNKATNGSFRIYDQNGNIDADTESNFIDPKGLPLPWFRDYMKITESTKFYGYSAIQLGEIIDGFFKYAKEIPQENLIPLYDIMLINAEHGYVRGEYNSINLKDKPQVDWVVTFGSKKDLGLINKCAPYIIYKQVFGSWSQHADVFGQPLRIGKTDLRDNERRQNMIEMFEDMEGATYGIFDPEDQIEFIETKGSSDPHNIYGKLIEKCDQAIAKIILSQTGTTDEKSYAGSAEVHKEILDDVIFSDKLDIMQSVNTELIPRMKKLGLISPEKKVYGSWEFDEELNTEQWAKVIQIVNNSGYKVKADEVSKKTGLELDEVEEIETVPANKMVSVMNNVQNYYKKCLEQ
jgi:predicted secreted protein